MGLIVLRTDWDLPTCSYIPDPMISPRTRGPSIGERSCGRPACAWCVLGYCARDGGAQGYGANGAPPDIPGRATLYFEVEHC
eukprot:COSAG01_NODE_485_length_16397_cov_48.193827_2_plen_82_part_00